MAEQQRMSYATQLKYYGSNGGLEAIVGFVRWINQPESTDFTADRLMKMEMIQVNAGGCRWKLETS